MDVCVLQPRCSDEWFVLPSQSNIINLVRKSSTNVILRCKWQKLVRICLREKKTCSILYIISLFVNFDVCNCSCCFYSGCGLCFDAVSISDHVRPGIAQSV